MGLFDNINFLESKEPTVKLEPESGGLFSNINFLQQESPDLDSLTFAEKAAYGAAQETTIGRNVLSLLQGAVESATSEKSFSQALEDLEAERQLEIDQQFPKFRGLEQSDEDLAVLSGRLGVAVADPATFAIPWLKIVKTGSLASRLTKLGATGASVAAADTFTRDLALHGDVSPTNIALSATVGGGSTLAGYGVERFISNKLARSLENADPTPVTINAPDISVDEASSVDKAIKSAASKTNYDTPKVTSRLSLIQDYQSGVEAIQSQVQRIDDRLSDAELPISESLEKTLKNKKKKLNSEKRKLLDKFALGAIDLANQKANLSANALEELAAGEGFTEKAARSIMTELTKPLYGAGSGAIYGFATREDSEDIDSVFMGAALGAGLGIAYKKIDSSERITSLVKDKTKMAINEAGFNYAKANLKHMFGATTATKMDAMGGWNKAIGNILFSRYGVAGDTVESRSLKAQSEWVGRITNDLGESSVDDDVLETLGESLFDFVPDDKLVGWKGLSGTRKALTEEQAGEVRRILPLLQDSQSFIKNRINEVGINFEELKFYGMPLRFDISGDVEEFSRHIEKAVSIHNKAVAEGGTGKKIGSAKSYLNSILGDKDSPDIKYTKGGSSPFVFDSKTKTYKFRPLAEFFEVSRKLTSPEAIKYLAENKAIILNVRDVLADYGSSSLKVAEFAEALGPNGELVNLALKRTKEAFKGKARTKMEKAQGLPPGTRYVDQLVGGIEAFWGQRGSHDMSSDGFRIATTFANLSYLTFVSFANLVDLTQPFVKSGVKASLQALRQKNVSRILPKKAELGGESFAEMTHFQYDKSFERELETLLKARGIKDNSSVSRGTAWINDRFFKLVRLKDVTSLARKFAYDAGVNRAFNLSSKFSSDGKLTKTLQKELDSLDLTVDDLKTIGKYSDIREAFEEGNARDILDIAGRKAAERDSIVPNVGNRLLFSQTNTPSVRSVGQFLSWSQAKSSELNAMIRQIENGDVKLLYRMALAAPVMVAFEELRRAATGADSLFEKEENKEQVDTAKRIARGLERTGMFSNFQINFMLDQGRYAYSSDEFSTTDSLSPALQFVSDLAGTVIVDVPEDLKAGDTEGAIKEIADIVPPFKQIQSGTKFLTGEDLLVDEPEKDSRKQPVNFKKGGEVNIPRAASEPDERIDKMTGRPYDQQAGTAFVDEEDPLRRLGFVGGGQVDPLRKLGFGV